MQLIFLFLLLVAATYGFGRSNNANPGTSMSNNHKIDTIRGGLAKFASVSANDDQDFMQMPDPRKVQLQIIYCGG